MNTVAVRSGRLYGYNTDYVGVLKSIERRVPLASSRVLLFGAGGSRVQPRSRWRAPVRSVIVCARRPRARGRSHGLWAAKRSIAARCAASRSTPS